MKRKKISDTADNNNNNNNKQPCEERMWLLKTEDLVSMLDSIKAINCFGPDEWKEVG